MKTPEEMNKIAKEIKFRIEAEFKHYNDILPHEDALAWAGYITALYQYKLLSQASYDEFLELLALKDLKPLLKLMHNIAEVKLPYVHEFHHCQSFAE